MLAWDVSIAEDSNALDERDDITRERPLLPLFCPFSRHCYAVV